MVPPVGRAAGDLVAFELGEVVVGVQVVQRAVLAEAFVEVAALDAVHERTAVGGVIQLRRSASNVTP